MEWLGCPCSLHHASTKDLSLYLDRCGCCSRMALRKPKTGGGRTICLVRWGRVLQGTRVLSLLPDAPKRCFQRNTVAREIWGNASWNACHLRLTRNSIQWRRNCAFSDAPKPRAVSRVCMSVPYVLLENLGRRYWMRWKSAGIDSLRVSNVSWPSQKQFFHSIDLMNRLYSFSPWYNVDFIPK